jgi:hypothetical protein
MSELDPKGAYTDPATVLSPKGSVENLRILHSTGEGGWSVAALDWEGEPKVGVRWNGHARNPIGNPQSRGIATWFLMPDELAPVVRNLYGDERPTGDDRDADVTRVRIRPKPRRIWEGVEQEPSDDEWVVSRTSTNDGRFEITNISTGHFMVVHRSQVQQLVRDSVRDTSDGPKHGILSLNVQMIFEDKRLRLEPVESFVGRLTALSRDLMRTGYAGKHDRVRALIREAHQALIAPTGTLGPWETECLNDAEIAVADNFLQLALNSIAAAMAVNKLPPEDYAHGFNYSRSRPARVNRR